MTTPGFIAQRSASDPRQTAERLEAALNARGLTLFARIDHAAGAAAVGQALCPTEVSVCGDNDRRWRVAGLTSVSVLL
jgi:uncharacterized protein (DUF302 family)